MSLGVGRYTTGSWDVQLHGSLSAPNYRNHLEQARPITEPEKTMFEVILNLARLHTVYLFFPGFAKRWFPKGWFLAFPPKKLPLQCPQGRKRVMVF